MATARGQIMASKKSKSANKVPQPAKIEPSEKSDRKILAFVEAVR
jgi:hypothetical protein